MYRRIFVILLALLCLVGCVPVSPQVSPALDDTVSQYEGDGFVLTHPAVFTLARETGESWYFTAEGHTVAFSLTREVNTYGMHSIEEYPEKMGIYSGVTVVDDSSFAVEKHIDDMLSGYFLYTVSEEYVYLLEYNYGGTAEERALSKRFAVETTS
ncbi:MAG: hypothetical protein E7552_07240 [Ruminococcaceae bacterium]|nr:hypothetical protein [Oscillospiraceae bacterium]